MRCEHRGRMVAGCLLPTEMRKVMTKADVKLLCEADDHLQWWAMVLFAEISELVDSSAGYGAEAVFPLIATKVKEFPGLVIERAKQKAKEAEEKEAKERKNNPEGTQSSTWTEPEKAFQGPA